MRREGTARGVVSGSWVGPFVLALLMLAVPLAVGAQPTGKVARIGIFGAKALGGMGGVNFGAQVLGTVMGIGWALLAGLIVYAGLKQVTPLRLTLEEEYDGADLSIHRIGATPDREANW